MFTPIGGLVSMDETPIATILRYLRELAGLRLAHKFAIILYNVIGGYKEHEPIKISLYISDVLFYHLKYRNSHCALKLGNKVTSFIDEAIKEAEGLEAPAILPTKIQCTVIEDLMIPVYHRDTSTVKFNFFDYYCEL